MGEDKNTDSPSNQQPSLVALPTLTPQKFRDAVLDILKHHENRYNESLERDLRSLWNLVQERRDANPSYTLFARLIQDSFEGPPSEFQYEWLKYVEEPDWLWDDGGYLLRSWKDFGAIIVARGVSGFEVLERTLLFQIADLNRMPDKTLRDPLRYFGRDSASGSTWFNFEVFTYWRCATAGLVAKLDVPMHQRQFARCDWATLAFLLSLGRLYE